METRNRNILLVVLGTILVLCCCCALLTGAVALYLISLRSSGPASQTEKPIVVITSAVTVRPGGNATSTTVRPTRTPAPRPEGGTPAPAEEQAGGDLTVPPDTENLLAGAQMPARDLRDLALRLKPGAIDIPVVVNATPPAYKVGDAARFWSENGDTQKHRQITATLRYMTDHVYMWVEDGITLDESDLKRSADRFESKTYPTDREFFGSEWTPGVDNDVHLSLLHATDLGENIAGYYSSSDEFSHLINRYSNEREMFYISADNVRPGSSFYDGVLAHEFQHMIHWANDRNEDSWVNEGMSELAGHLNGFETGGSEIAYSENPDTQLTTWADSSGDRHANDAHYGASYLFMGYFLDRFGENLTKAAVASPDNSIAGFNAALAKSGRTERFDDIFADWLVANYLDQPDANPKGLFGYTDIDPQRPAIQRNVRQYPAEDNLQVSQYGANYIALKGQGDLDISFTGQITVGLVATTPQGRYAWWSNRGDNSDATLTRAFDLRKLSSATLAFSTWYSIEEGYDYAYVEASSDGGKRWQILPGRRTTDKNPAGNAFGTGWTEKSGGGKTPKWIDETVDLTPFAGNEILLRFEYVTDDAVNGPGFLLDNMAIPELEYRDSGEGGMAGWQPDGWALTDNVLSQRWLVQLVSTGRDSVEIQRMQVGPDGRGHLTLKGSEKLDDVVLIISALAPVTTEKANYSYSIMSR